MWIERRLHNIRTTGKFNISGEKDVDLNQLSNVKYIKEMKLVKSLNLSRTSISSFEGCPKMPKVIDVIADGSQISSLKNIKAFTNLRKISLKNTPKLDQKNMKLSVVLAVPEITTVDGKLISEKIRQKAKEFPNFAGELVNNGWMAVYPVPSEDEFKEICKEYSVEFTQDEIFIKSQSADDLAEEKEEEDDEFDFEAVINQLHEEHESMLTRSQALFGIVTDEEAFGTKLSEVLAQHGMQVDPNDIDGLVGAVEELCKDQEDKK